MSVNVAIIPARGGSKGISRKNLIDLNGKPMIEYTIKSALNSKSIDEVYVSTEDAEIKNISLGLGVKVIDRPKELASDDASTYSVLNHAYNILCNKIKIRYLVCLQPTSPLRTYEHIDNAFKLVEKDMGTIISVTEDKRYRWQKNKDGVITPKFTSRRPRQKINDIYIENGAIYICNVSVFVDDNDKLGMGINSNKKVILFKMKDLESIEIDTELDLIVTETILSKNE